MHYLGGSIGGVSKLNPLDDYKRLADLMNAVGEQCKKAGLQFAYHNLNVEFREHDGVVPYDWLLAHTDPHSVQLEIDCYWLTRAGGDPVEYFEKYPGRTPLLHIKDRKPGYAPSTIPDPGPGPFTEVGHGSINWKRILAAAPGGGFKALLRRAGFLRSAGIRESQDELRLPQEPNTVAGSTAPPPGAGPTANAGDRGV